MRQRRDGDESEVGRDVAFCHKRRQSWLRQQMIEQDEVEVRLALLAGDWLR